MSAHLSAPLDDEDAWRLARSKNEVLGLIMRALRVIDRHKLLPRDRDFIAFVCGKPPEHLTDKQREHVHRLSWRYRHNIPRHLAPRVNPDDPIVRAMAARDTANG